MIEFGNAKDLGISIFYELAPYFTAPAVKVKESLDGVFEKTWGGVSREAASFEKVWDKVCTAAPEAGKEVIINPPSAASVVSAVRAAAVHVSEQASTHLPTALSSVRATFETCKKEIANGIPFPVKLAWRWTPTSWKVIGVCALIVLCYPRKSEQHVHIYTGPQPKP